MKKLNYILWILFVLSLVFQGCKKENEEEKTGSIYGVVTDKATSELIKGAEVELKFLGNKTVTGSDGHYEFNDIKAGSYQLYITKTDYVDFISNTITVTAGQIIRADVQIEKLPHALRIVNDKGEDIDELDFGEQEDDITRSFNIFNDGPRNLFWEVTKTADWITNVSDTLGTLKPGKQQSIIVTISRNLLQDGDNITTLHVTSNDGTKDLKVKATKGNPNNASYITLEADRLMVQKKDLGCVDHPSAVSMCDNSTVGEFTDWRLPTIDELMVLYEKRDYIGGFKSDYYWSSTSYDDYWYENINFKNGSINDSQYYNKLYVRAVRTYNGGGGGGTPKIVYYSCNPDEIDANGNNTTISVTMKNKGTAATTSNTTVTLSTTDSYLTIKDNEKIYGTMEINATLSKDYVVKASPNSPDNHEVTIEVTAVNGNNTWQSSFTLTIKNPNGGGTPKIVYYSCNPDEIDANGNNTTISVTMKNKGTAATTSNTTVTLSTTDSYLTIKDNEKIYGTMEINATLSKNYVVKASPDSPDNHEATIEVTAVNGNNTWQSSFTLTIKNSVPPVPPGSGDEFFYDFEDGTLQGWTTIDADWDGNNWMNSNDLLSAGYGYNSDYCVLSQSYINYVGALTPDNYLVSPQVNIGSSSTFSFRVCAQDNMYPAEHYGVAISTTGNTNAADFETIWEETLTAKNAKGQKGSRGTNDQGIWYRKSIDLSNYAGQQVYIALRHFDCTDNFYIDVDNITLTNDPIPPTPPTPPTITEWLYYDDGTMVDAIGTTGHNIYWGVMFPASMMNEYAGTSMTKIKVFDYKACAATANIYYGGSNAPGTLVYTQNFNFTGIYDWLELSLTSPLPIDGTKNVWVTFYQNGTDYPAAVSNDVTNDPNGRWVSTDGGSSWKDLASTGLPGYTWMIRAYVTNETKGGKIIPLEPFKGKKAEGKITSIKSR